MSSRPRIADVARRAGVSVTTVSHTFSGNGVVAAETRERVRAAAHELGYRPDVLAQGLRRNRLSVLALVVRPLDRIDPGQLHGVDYFLRLAGAAAMAASQSASPANQSTRKSSMVRSSGDMCWREV